MPRLTFQATGTFRDGVFAPAAHRRVVVEVRGDDGKVADRFEVNPLGPRSRQRAVAHGPLDADVIRLCDETLASGQAAVWEAVAAPLVPPGHLTVTCRGFTDATGEQHTGPARDLLPRLLPLTASDRLLTWAGKEEACCLDVDYHATSPPPRPHLEAWVEARLAPRPVAWHFSRGGGVHAFYVRTERFTAEELAAAAAIRFRTIDPSAGLDLVTHVRGAGQEPLRLTGGGSAGAASLPGAGEADESAVADWLDTHGMRVGERYDHDKCPINPTSAAGQRQPVSVGEAGVWCWSCASKGLSLGSRKAGFASFAALVGSPGTGDVPAMVQNRVHWGHAKWVLTEKYELPEYVARLGYAAALKAHHEDMGEDEVATVFNRDTGDMARAANTWVNLLSGSYAYDKNTSPALLGTLPSCLARDDKGKLKPIASRVAYMLQGHDLTNRGYGNLRVVRGFRLAKQFLPAPAEAQVSVLERELRGSARAPRYLQRSGRKAVGWAEAVFERYFPGLSWTALRSQVCAAGCSQETRLGLQPLTFLAGPSGAAKTTTIKLAAGILGTCAPDVAYHKDEEKLKRAIHAAGQRGGFAACNEFLKDHQRANNGRFDPRAAMETVLNLTPESLVHVMWVGPRPLGTLPAVVFTEPNCPYLLRDYRQIARRVRLVKLYRAKDTWKETLAGLNLTPDTLHLYRLRDSELAEAADVILSDLIDTYFSAPMTWDSIADSLGCPTIEGSTDFDDPKPYMRDFFRLVCETPDVADPRLAKKYPNGYKRIHRTDDGGDGGTLVDAWNQFADRDWFESKIMMEQDWAGLIGSGHEVQLDVKNDGVNSVFVRFRVGPTLSPQYINDKIPRETI